MFTYDVLNNRYKFKDFFNCYYKKIFLLKMDISSKVRWLLNKIIKFGLK